MSKGSIRKVFAYTLTRIKPHCSYNSRGKYLCTHVNECHKRTNKVKCIQKKKHLTDKHIHSIHHPQGNFSATSSWTMLCNRLSPQWAYLKSYFKLINPIKKKSANEYFRAITANAIPIFMKTSYSSKTMPKYVPIKYVVFSKVASSNNMFRKQ